jgi:hypothetical protein
VGMRQGGETWNGFVGECKRVMTTDKVLQEQSNVGF